MVGSDEDRGRSRRPGAEDRALSGIGRVTLCTVCTVHEETRSAGFLVESQNEGRRFVSGLASKLRLMICQWFGFKTGGNSFSQFGLKTGGGGFPGLGLKTGRYGLVIWTSKSPRQFLGLGPKTKWAMICRLRHKTDRG
jgi:hypothetical protein